MKCPKLERWHQNRGRKKTLLLWVLAVKDKRTGRCQHPSARVGQSAVSTLIHSFLQRPSDVQTYACAGTLPPPFETLRFYVELGTYRAQTRGTRRNTRRWRHVSAPCGRSSFLPVARIRGQLSPRARLDLSSSNNVRISEEQHKRTTFVLAVNKSRCQILWAREHGNTGMREPFFNW